MEGLYRGAASPQVQHLERGRVAMSLAPGSVATMRVLIVRLGAFGDIIHTLPLAADLAAAGHAVTWLCEDRWMPIIDGSPAISRIVPLPRKLLRSHEVPLTHKLRALRRVVRALRSERFDAVIDAQGLAKSAGWAAFSGARLRVGHGCARAREGSWLVSQRRAPLQAVHVIDQQRALALTLGVRPSGGWRFPLPAWRGERDRASQWLARERISHPWVLNVGAGWPTKVWPEARQSELLALLRGSGHTAVLVWGNDAELAAARRICAAAGHGAVAPPTTIPQLGGLLAHAEVVISGDTGPLHLALALGVPAVGLFGPVPAERNGPRGRGYRTLQAPGAAWERRDVSKVDMAAISAEAVLGQARAALSRMGA